MKRKYGLVLVFALFLLLVGGVKANAANNGDDMSAYGNTIKITPDMIENHGISPRVNVSSYDVTGGAHLQGVGNTKLTVVNRNTVQVGTTGQARRLEGFWFKVTGSLAPHFEYRAHVQSIGWQSFVTDNRLAGTTGQAKRVEAIQMLMKDLIGVKVMYRVHLQGTGWTGWKYNGEIAGTTGQSRRLEAIQFKFYR